MNCIFSILSAIILSMLTNKSNNIFFEYVLSSTPGKRAVIVLIGVPAQPKHYNIFDWFTKEGFDVFFPRYEGTWESDGVFLSPSPTAGINQFIESIHKGIMLDDKMYCTDNVYIFGSSFGGGVALALDDTPHLKKVCAVSPVVSYSQVKGIETLGAYLQTNFPNGYRFRPEEWEKLIHDDLYCPLKETKLPSHKIMLVAGKNDDQIMFSDLKQYAVDKGINNYLVEETGHITPSRVSQDLFAKIILFFNKK